MNKNLIISEKFYSIQGEGQTMGVPSIFLRLSGCNILCNSESWICDSIEVWRKGNKTSFDDVFTFEEIHLLKNDVHLIITGGEPLLHQKKIVEFLDWFIKKYSFKPIIEIETNGTILPLPEMKRLVNYWNCSPKLANSGETATRRLKPGVIKVINTLSNPIFKFVIEKHEDVLNMLKDYGELVDHDKIVLMPAGETQEKLNKTRMVVVNECLNLGFRYSERLHIVIWNQKTGV